MLLICESNKDRRPLQYCTCIYRVQKRQARNYSFSYLAKNLLLISPSCKLDEVLRYWRKEENFSEILFVPTLVLKCRPTCWILFQGGIYIKTLCRLIYILKRTGLYQFQTSKQTIKNITKKILFPTTKMSYCDKYVLLEPCSNSILVHLRKKINIFQAANWQKYFFTYIHISLQANL